MGLEKMLEYQKIDMGLYKLEKEYNQSKEIETSLKCKKMFEDRKENLQKLRSELDESLAMLDKIQEQVDVILAEKEWETYDVEKVNDLAELSELRKSLTKLEENYNKENKRDRSRKQENQFRNVGTHARKEEMQRDFGQKEGDFFGKGEAHSKATSSY